METPLLEVHGLTRNFGGLVAVREFSFKVSTGQIKALVGPNGAGKTTVLDLVSGFLKPLAGEIIFKGQSLTGLAPHRIARLGIIRTFQNLGLFDQLTVLENILVGCDTHSGFSFLQCVLHTPSFKKDEQLFRETAYKTMAIMGLSSEAEKLVTQLPLGKQRIVETGRAFASRPQLLLLDEPCAGLTPEEITAMASLLKQIRDTGVSILLVEHNMRLVMSLSDEVLVMNFGEKVAEGTFDCIRKNPVVIKAYLGEKAL